MNDFAVKNSHTLTQYDIEKLLRQFGGKETDYVEIVDVEKNQEHFIQAVEVKIFSGPGQSGSSFWSQK